MSTLQRLTPLRWIAIATVAIIIVYVAFTRIFTPPSLNALPSPPAVNGSTYTLHAQFTNVLDLPIGAKVKQSGAVIGDVTNISTKDFHANVTLQISTKTKLMLGTTAEVRFTTPLGEDYIAIYPPAKTATKFFAPGDTLTQQFTGAAPSIEDAFAALSLLLNGGGIQQIATIIRELDKTLTGRTGTIRSVIDQLHTLVAALNSHRGDIDLALAGIQKVAVTLGAGEDVITRALDEFPPAFKVISEQTGKINDLLTKVTTLGTAAESVLNRSTDTLLSDIRQVQPALDSLTNVRAQLVPTMNKLVLFGSAIAAAAPGDYLTAAGTINLDFPASTNNTVLVPPASAYSSSSSSASAPASGQSAVTTLLTGGLQ
ncbi:MAG: MCE family protein [Actinomycetota bacterium]|nr:MCE family protein [Actinomycetota bacterium]